MSRTVVELAEDPATARAAEERHFQSFFGQEDEELSPEPEPEPEAAVKQPNAQDSEVSRKLGRAAVARERVEDLREQEEEEERRRGEGGGKPKGFEQRGRRHEMEELEENEAKERARQRRVHLRDDNLMVGDVVVPGHLEKWVLDPMGDHKQRHKKQRLKDERIQKVRGGKCVGCAVALLIGLQWYELHGMYYERRKQSGFKRDPVDTEMTIRQKRVSMLVQEALEKVLAVDFEHEKVPELFVEGVEMSVDMRCCKILWGSDAEGVEGFLHRQGPTIRMMLTKRVQLKYSPTLDFVRTDFDKKQARVEAILEEMVPGEAEGGNEEGADEEVQTLEEKQEEGENDKLDEAELRELEQQMESPEHLRAEGNLEEADDEEGDEEDVGENDEDENEEEEEEEEDPEFEEWFKKIPVKVTYVK